MAITQQNHHPKSEQKLLKLCSFWQPRTATISPSSQTHNHQTGGASLSNVKPSGSVSSVAMSILPARRRLRLDPSTKFYFPNEPGKQVKSVVNIKNGSKSYVAFKFQTTEPKSCYMRPPGGIIAPGESIFATVFKFMEHSENNEKYVDQNRKIKFKLMSLKVKEGTDYAPELFDEQKEKVTIEQILRVVFLDPNQPSSALEKLKRQLEEAESAIRTPKKPPARNRLGVGGGALVIDEWKERREKYLARQKVEAVDSSSS
ncbi:hypothetical protein Leryth_013553 [Lithospermum erythrorhizon]|nr:hypothetical protein Leryth_013553 [Lithospermum erythrorhizon]